MTIDELEQKDSSFNSSIFISKANNMVKKLYNAVTLDELDTVDHFASDEVFNKFKEELATSKEKKEKLIYNQVNINTEINDIEETDDQYRINCSVYCKYYKYYLSEEGEFLHGNQDKRDEIIKQAVFCKKKTAKRDVVDHCSGCGFSLNINDNGKCPNCGRIFDLENFDYYLDKFE